MVSNHYVYRHLDELGRVVYVGRSRDTNLPRPFTTHNRKPEHASWMLEQFNLRGFSFVKVDRGLTKKEATDLETRLIKDISPMFNRMMVDAANAGRAQDNHNSLFSEDEVAFLRAEWSSRSALGISMREFHRTYIPKVTWSTCYKLLKNKSY